MSFAAIRTRIIELLQVRLPSAAPFLRSLEIDWENNSAKLTGLPIDIALLLAKEPARNILCLTLREASTIRVLRLQTIQGKHFSIYVDEARTLREMNPNPQNPNEGILRELRDEDREFLKQFDGSCSITCQTTNELISNNQKFRALVGFRGEQHKSLPISMDKFWLPQEFGKLQTNLERIDFAGSVGNQREPYEYSIRSMLDVCEAMAQGASEEEAIASARLVDIGAIYYKLIIRGRVCRLALHVYKRFSNLRIC